MMNKELLEAFNKMGIEKRLEVSLGMILAIVQVLPTDVKENVLKKIEEYI